MTAVDEAGGLIAEFAEPDALLAAVRRARQAGYRRLDAFTPFPVKGISDALQVDVRSLAWIAIAGFIGGLVAGLLLQWYLNVINYPIDVGGRPLAAWPGFALPALEIAVLGAVVAALAAMLIADRLPRLHHLLFDVDRFGLASRDRFFLMIGADDPRFDGEQTRRLLAGLAPRSIAEVPR